MKTFQPFKTMHNSFGLRQQLYRFANGYGASVIDCPEAYGSKPKPFELCVIVFGTDGDYKTAFNTPVADEVIGFLDEHDVQVNLALIAALPKKG